MRLKILSFITLLTFSAFSALADNKPAKPTLQILIGEGAPFATRGKNKGILVDLVNKATEELGYDYKVHILPWNRAFKQAQKKRAPIILLNVVRTKDRENDFRWIMPLVHSNTVFLSTDGVQHSIETAKRNKSVLVAANTLYHNHLIKAGFTNITAVSASHCKLIPMLTNGRASIMYTGQSMGISCLKKHKALDDITISGTIYDVSSYMADNGLTPKPIIDAYKKSISKLIASPYYKELKQKYGKK